MAEFSNKKPLIAVVGPTASGKTALAIRIAKEFSGEIVSLDSMQIYKHLDIGTAKPSVDEMDGIKHYMIDCIDPKDPFSASDYGEMATFCINEIYDKGKIPVICGGTGLYLDALLYGYNMSETAADPLLRERLYKEAEEKGNFALYEKLKEIDPQSAEEIHPNNVKRVVRALEINYLTGKTRSEQSISSKEPLYNALLFGIEWERGILYDRIDKRVDIMMESGLENEVRTLIEDNVLPLDLSSQASQAIGYKEMISYIKGEITLDEAVGLIKMNSRRYAKRQLTWFKRNNDIHWLDAVDNDASKNALTLCRELLKKEDE